MSLGADILIEGDLDKAVDAIVKAYETRERRAAQARPGEARMPRLLVAVAGRPGSGKSTVVDLIAASVRARLAHHPRPVSAAPHIRDMFTGHPAFDAEGVEVCVMPMDGYHLYRTELDAMDDPEKAHRRRGAEWTFNPTKMAADIKAIRTPDSDGYFRDVAVPSFDHGKGDPVEHDIIIKASASIVIVEGNYVLYRGTKEWASVCAQFDLGIFLACSKAVATERLCRRHMKAWNIPRAKAMRFAEVVIHSKEASPRASKL